MKPKKKKQLSLPEEDLIDWRRFFSGLVAGLITTILVLAVVVFAKQIFQLGGAASSAVMQHLQRIQVLLVDTTVRWEREFQNKLECIFGEF